jgi:hypothetical protein
MQLDWDPEIDTPATVAVLGGGPVGVEAALYARFLGYSVLLFDTYKVGHRQLAWGEHRVPDTWANLTTPLGLAALAAQGTAGEAIDEQVHVTYRDYVERYLLPVARTDLLYDSVQINSPVLSVSRTGCGPGTQASLPRRSEQEFRILVDSRQRGEYTQLVDIVLDCNGLAASAGLASGGGLAIGQRAHTAEMRSGKLDVLGKARGALAGKHTLLFGGDSSACANAIDLAQLAAEVPETRTTWIIPKHIGAPKALDLPTTWPADMTSLAHQLADNQHPSTVALTAWGIESIQLAEGWKLRLQTGEEETLDISGDVFINCNLRRRDWSFCDGLLVAENSSSGFLTAEPHYYVLGEKSLGAHMRFADALEQIRSVFGMIGGRSDLDLYDTIRRQKVG